MYFRVVKIALFCCGLVLSNPANCQTTCSVTDSGNGKPIENAEVFINGTTIGSFTDADGRVQLPKLEPSFYNLVIYKNGYSIFSSVLRIGANKSYHLNLSLQKTLGKIHGKANSTLVNTLKSSLLSDNSIVINPKSLIFRITEKDTLVSSLEPVTIKNESLGYSLKLFVQNIQFRDLGRAPVKFDILESISTNQSILREKERLKVYQEYIRHFLCALVGNRLAGEGFKMVNEKEASVDTSVLISTSSPSGYYRVNFTNPVTVRFDIGNEHRSMKLSFYGPVEANARGILLNPKSLKEEGGAMISRISDRLPDDYKPIKGGIEDVFSETMRPSLRESLRSNRQALLSSRRSGLV